jgi:hypothetical protein
MKFYFETKAVLGFLAAGLSATTGCLAAPEPSLSGVPHQAKDELWIDRSFETVEHALRFSGRRLQLYSFEPGLVIQWHEKQLTPAEAARLWGRIDRVQLPRMDSIHRPPEPEAGAPPLIRETDEFEFWLRREGKEHRIRILHRSSGPASAVQLAEELEEFTRQAGPAFGGAKHALLAEPPDVPNFPREGTLADFYRASGEEFVRPDPAWLEKVPSFRRAIEQPGWLFAATAMEDGLPQFVEWAGRPLRLRWFTVHPAAP